MKSLFDACILQNLFEKSFSGLSSGALVDSDGNTLFLKYQNLTDIGTFPAAALTSDQYMQIQNNDFVIVNDPYSGGTILTNMTLIMGLDIPVGPRKSDHLKLLISSRISFKPHVIQSKSVEDEGIRIPPSPLKTHGEWNKDLFQFMQAHPKIPDHFEDAVKDLSVNMESCRDQLLAGIRLLGLKLSKKFIQKYLDDSYRRAKLALSDLSIGEKGIERAVASPKEKLAMRVEVLDDKVLFDFTNSTNSTKLHLTDAATAGACAGALFSVLSEEIPINAGTLKIIDVVTPKGSMVNAKYPEPVFLGFTDGVALIAQTAIELIGKIDPRKSMAQSGFSQCSVEVSFESGPHYFEYLESGVAATKDRSGASAIDLWKRNQLMPSIESAENILPIKFLSSSYRQNSGGSGNFTGGNGVTRSVEVQAPGQMTWMISPPLAKPEGLDGGKAASPAEIFLIPPGGQKTKLDSFGSQAIEKGTVIIMNSAGGGGSGVPEEDEESEAD